MLNTAASSRSSPCSGIARDHQGRVHLSITAHHSLRRCQLPVLHCTHDRLGTRDCLPPRPRANTGRVSCPQNCNPCCCAQARSAIAAPLAAAAFQRAQRRRAGAGYQCTARQHRSRVHQQVRSAEHCIADGHPYLCRCIPHWRQCGTTSCADNPCRLKNAPLCALVVTVSRACEGLQLTWQHLFTPCEAAQAKCSGVCPC